MNNVNEYSKIARNIAKNIVVRPSENIEEKIINKISNIDESDRKLLDEKFLDYLRKNNSRLYLLNEKIKNNSGKVAALGSIVALLVIFLVAVCYLSSSENSSDNK